MQFIRAIRKRDGLVIMYTVGYIRVSYVCMLYMFFFFFHAGGP